MTSDEPPAEPPQPELRRSLSLLDATMINVGTIIGSGIFLVPASNAALVDSSLPSLLVWVVAGLFSLFGALTAAELGACMPKTGGMYVYLKEAYGPLSGFLYGWALFLVIQTGTVAAVTIAFASYLGYFIPLSNFTIKVVAIVCIASLTLVNYFGVRLGAWTQNSFTFAKVGAMTILIGLPFALGVGSMENLEPIISTESFSATTAPFGLALLAALWCFDGWIHTSYVAGEIIDPEKNLPRANIYSMLIVLAVYLAINVAYIFVLSLDKMAGSTLVAADMAEVVVGPLGASVVSVLVLVSTFGATNGYLLAGARVYYAMARDHLFFQKVAEVHPKHLTPFISLGFQALWSSFLVFTGTYEQLFTYVIFAEYIFFGMMGVAVIVLRRKYPELPRPYKTWGYPIVPAAFSLFTGALLINTLVADPRDALIGTFLVLSGLPAYFFWRRRSPQARSE